MNPLPKGWYLLGYQIIKRNDYLLLPDGTIGRATHNFHAHAWAMAPYPNNTTAYVPINVSQYIDMLALTAPIPPRPPEGWELDEIRTVRKGDYFLHDWELCHAEEDLGITEWTLKPKSYRNIALNHLIAR